MGWACSLASTEEVCIWIKPTLQTPLSHRRWGTKPEDTINKSTDAASSSHSLPPMNNRGQSPASSRVLSSLNIHVHTYRHTHEDTWGGKLMQEYDRTVRMLANHRSQIWFGPEQSNVIYLTSFPNGNGACTFLQRAQSNYNSAKWQVHSSLINDVLPVKDQQLLLTNILCCNRKGTSFFLFFFTFFVQHAQLMQPTTSSSLLSQNKGNMNSEKWKRKQQPFCSR